MSRLDLMRETEKNVKTKLSRKNKRDAKLQELERQLEFAESRCGTLKQQLDYIKLLYGCTRNTYAAKELPKEEGHGDGTAVNQYVYCKGSTVNGNLPNREDGDGPDCTSQTKSHSTTTTIISSKKKSTHDKREIKTKSPKPKNQLKILKIKKKISKRAKKRRKSEDGSSSKVSNESSQTHSLGWQDPIVELYKNMAVNVESESGFDTLARNSHNKPNEVLSEVLRHKANQKSNSKEEVKAKSCNCISSKKSSLKEEGMQTDFPPDHFAIQNKPNDLMETLIKETKPEAELKSYCQPTISSKRKQVERDIYSNLTNLNIRNIPFIAARSTAPSHNIGINIQQVLSIIKKRQPLSENLLNVGSDGNPLLSLISSRKLNSGPPETDVAVTESKTDIKRAPRTNLSHWKSTANLNVENSVTSQEKAEEDTEWSFKIDKLKKVLVFLHEDFSSLGQKYKRLQKKLTKRNITKTDAKDELGDIEKELEKKEQEIVVVIALYKEVINLKEKLKQLQEKYNLMSASRNFALDGLKQSNSAHFQMTSLLRKIQNFQEQLKG